MPFIPVPGAALVEIRASLDSQEIENTLGFYRADEEVVPANLLDLADSVEALWAANALPLLPNTYVMRSVVATSLESQFSYQVTSTNHAGDAGTSSFVAEPNNVSLTVQFKTALRGRSYRGRNYWPALTDGVVVNNEVTAAHVDAIVAVYTAFLGVVAAGWTWVVISRFTNNAPRNEGVTVPVQTALVVDNIVDSQRRRLPKRGR